MSSWQLFSSHFNLLSIGFWSMQGRLFHPWAPSFGKDRCLASSVYRIREMLAMSAKSAFDFQRLLGCRRRGYFLPRKWFWLCFIAVKLRYYKSGQAWKIHSLLTASAAAETVSEGHSGRLGLLVRRCLYFCVKSSSRACWLYFQRIFCFQTD